MKTKYICTRCGKTIINPKGIMNNPVCNKCFKEFYNNDYDNYFGKRKIIQDICDFRFRCKNVNKNNCDVFNWRNCKFKKLKKLKEKHDN